MRDFTGWLPVPYLPALPFERHAQVALLWTSWDRREDWLRAGQALQRVLLTATVHGVRTSMLHQAMEWLDLRAAMGGSRQPVLPAVADPVRVRPRGRPHATRGRARHTSSALGPEPAGSDARAVPSDSLFHPGGIRPADEARVGRRAAAVHCMPPLPLP
ncbi:hypothetical protein [Streptomyces sp. NPDC057438]|uniref:hypothetical protein n=1 Tax=Streptomyces sp. NPDC057438 TaxID=3346133 RepID=UPI0036D0EA9E